MPTVEELMKDIDKKLTLYTYALENDLSEESIALKKQDLRNAYDSLLKEIKSLKKQVIVSKRII